MTIFNKSFKDKDLKKLWENNIKKGIPPEMVNKVKDRLSYIDAIRGYPPEIFTYRFHEYKGKNNGTYSIDVTGNYRLLWETDEDEDPINIRLQNVH